MLQGRRPGVRFEIFFPARFRITHNNEEKEFLDATEATDYVKKKSHPKSGTKELTVPLFNTGGNNM